ncbi:MAG: hypothetical protein Q8P34_19180, partial [Bacteroidota bacterium]|nr:hypothetical protein [Bacteroidota bacterium]
MRKFLLFLFVIGGFIFLLILMYGVKRYHVLHYLFSKREANSIEINTSTPVLAVFSFRSEETNQTLKSFHHYKLKLNKVSRLRLDSSAIAHLSDTIPLMITVETLGKYVFPSRGSNPIKDVVKGRYDRVIKQLCTQLIGTRPNVYLRFNPEMEVPGNNFLWQRFGPVYIDAFRHFSALCKTYAPHVKQVWGPAGYPGSMEYYPGDDLVDAASITIKSDSEMPLTKYPTNYPVAYDLFRRLHRLRHIDKPIFVLGSKQCANDSIDNQLVSSISQKINQERSIAYTDANFKRPELKYESNPDRKLEIGLYDPQSLLNEEEPLTVEHLFVDFGSLYSGKFKNDFNKVVERGHNVIVTFEPFRIPEREDDLQVLQHVTEG